MKISGNTILITGGGSGIGRALAEALHAKGNKVVIAGRREALLDAVTAALLPHLLKQERAAILTVSSGLAFVPLATTPTYSATKAAIHSWSMALREQLKATPVEVVEIAPPYVQTELLGPQQAVDPAAMPLAEFTAEVMTLLESAPASGEIIVERCKPLRFAAENGQVGAIFAQLAAQHG